MKEKKKNKEQPPRTFLYALQRANRTTLERLMIELALRTNVTGESAIIHDICALSEVPALPDIFVSQKKSSANLEQENLFFTTAAGAAGHHYGEASRVYQESFFPHIALKLRCEVYSSVSRWADRCAQSAPDYDETDRSSYGEQYPLPATLAKETYKAYLKKTPADKWGGKRKNAFMRLSLLVDEEAGVCKTMHNHRQLQEETPRFLSYNNIVLLLLPLSTFLPRFLQYQSQKTGRSQRDLQDEIPPVWEALGCYPHLAVVQGVKRNKVSLSLLRRPSPIVVGPITKEEGESPEESPFFMEDIADFLTAFYARGVPLYVKWLGSLNSTFTTLSAIRDVHHTEYAPTIYDPTVTADVSESFYSIMDFYLASKVLQRVRNRLLLGASLNDWQVKAVAGVLYAVKPSWDRCPPLTAEDDRHKQGRSFELTATPQLLIIEGPPGTGKTQTIASLVLNVLLHTPGARILICAPSNCAVDEALLRIKRLQATLKKEDTTHLSPSSLMQVHNVVNASVLRVGVRESTDPKVLGLVPPVFLDDMVEYHAAKRYMNMQQKREIIAASSVVCSTLGSLNQVSRHGQTFDVVIIDEASQATEADALQGVILATEKCVLVGDSRQLQPTVMCKQASVHGLKRSLSVRLMRNHHLSFVLRTQYRMHPDIAAFPNHYIYNDALENAPVVTERNVLPPKLNPKKMTIAHKLSVAPRFGFVNVRSIMQKDERHSFLNKGEAKALLLHLRQLREYLQLSWEEYGKQVGVITFYKAQRGVPLLHHEQGGESVYSGGHRGQLSRKGE
ncbi:regulator of nonsense transcripts 1 [Angomonas deanei]|uniref:Type III restriction enzyme, res subunit/AAA domain containing protein, putative n=1 Tax=Angomonas deanei TaxID=59799 RepID=A0A7G2CNF1_9TRYP|nr:regulator of nonsense transcripts 1 [Angomonas deanei]CAD2220451.1 Type III restriction enzyme, res subunit/AAA domain containing protein, putative [Angomonas deanei]|eukprot:EPY20769.1 regulator of nonsense transcripts 1 [Angomonas deanei]